MACVGQVTCEYRHLAVVLICITSACTSFSKAGFMVNSLDLAPRYAGILFGIHNTFATVAGMITPVIAGVLTPSVREQQKNGAMCSTFVLPALL
uniref:Major facilitator superfamily (MFS) profile domain-containing protein n=1 Tax=Biomphalaria glabrata TaxID=6526 RepID=A0A2C9LVE5_BIOGL